MEFIYNFKSPTFMCFTYSMAKKITIEDECWLATDVYVAPGIAIGKGTVVGARSSVFKDLPAGKVCVGSPAKPIKDRTVEK
jgi:putative colanic acid biosynthesis acetyltransferase WcaF